MERRWPKAQSEARQNRSSDLREGRDAQEFNRQVAVRDGTIKRPGGSGWFFLKAEHFKLNEALAQKSLTEAKPRKSF